MGSSPALKGPSSQRRTVIAPGASHLEGFATLHTHRLYSDIMTVARHAPFRHMKMSRGFSIAAAMTNCGELGWWSDPKGYRYSPRDPDSGRPWPPMPSSFSTLAEEAAAAAGYWDFRPNACLINRYAPGTKMGLHQDRDEGAFEHPIVSVSLGLSVNFLFGGASKSDPRQKIPLNHGDVVVFGGASRLNYHGVGAVRKGEHPSIGPFRYNLTLRYVSLP